MGSKYILLIVVISMLSIMLGCSTKNEQKKESQESRESLVADFINDVSYFESVNSNTVITAFEREATAIAERRISLNKDNIASILVTAKHYKTLVITVEDHTIVKIVDLSDCQPSGSWGTCMPLGEGYVKRGELVKQRDYINNIIGSVDEQERTAFLFN